MRMLSPVENLKKYHTMKMSKLLAGCFFTAAMMMVGAANAGAQQNDSTTVQQEAPAMVKAVRTVEGAFLNSSAGGDRLGGNKIGYLSPNVVMEVVETTEDVGAGPLYKVKLSENRTAYIMPENVVDTLVEPGYFKTVIAESGSVSNVGKADRIALGIGARKPYLVYEELDPHVMTIDIYGVNNNINWLTQKLDLKAVKSVDLIQLDGDILRVKVVFQKNVAWGFRIGYKGNTLEVYLKHLPEKFTLKGMTVALDAGHGGEQPGAISHKMRLNEKDINLDFAYTLKKMLEKKGAKVILTRPDDRTMTMNERKAAALDNDVDFLISLHNNAAGPKVRGTSTYYKYIVNRELAKCILEQVITLPDVGYFGLVGNFNFSLGQPVEYPNALLEGLFMSNEQDEAMLADPRFRRQMMEKTLKGIENWLKRCKEACK